MPVNYYECSKTSQFERGRLNRMLVNYYERGRLNSYIKRSMLKKISHEALKLDIYGRAFF